MAFHLKIHVIFFVSKNPDPALNLMTHLLVVPNRIFLASPKMLSFSLPSSFGTGTLPLFISQLTFLFTLPLDRVFLLPLWEAGEPS